MDEENLVKSLDIMQKFLSATDSKFEEIQTRPEERIVDDIDKQIFKTHGRGRFSKIYKLDEKYGFTLDTHIRGSTIRFVLLENGKKIVPNKDTGFYILSYNGGDEYEDYYDRYINDDYNYVSCDLGTGDWEYRIFDKDDKILCSLKAFQGFEISTC